MKTAAFITFSLLITWSNIFAQCTDCQSLDEALIAPERVKSLHLSNENLEKFPEQLSLFINLEFLDLSSNYIFEIPENVIMPSVKTLNLNHNLINPWKIKNVGQSFPKLEILDLSNNQLAFLANGIETLGNLKQLDLSDNKLTKLPFELQFLGNLEVLDLSSNLLEYDCSTLGYLWKLTSLNVLNNPNLYPDKVLNSLTLNNSIRSLSIDIQKWSTSASDDFKKLPLETVTIGSGEIKLPVGITQNSTLKRIVFENVSFSTDPSEEISKMNKLSELSFINCVLPIDLKSVDQISKLELTNTPIPENIGLFKHLDILDLTGNALSITTLISLKSDLSETEIRANLSDASNNFKRNEIKPIVPQPVNHYSIPSNDTTTIEQGIVKLEIPKNAFLTQQGGAYLGYVDLSLKVYENPVSVALDGVPMIYEKDSVQEIFASTGMIDISAKTSEGKDLKPNPNAPIMVSMTNLQPSLKSGLFVNTKDSASRWEQVTPNLKSFGIDEKLKNKIDSLNKLDLKSFVDVKQHSPLYTIQVKQKRLDASTLVFKRFGNDRIQAYKNNVEIFKVEPIGKQISNRTWQIDTIITPELSNLLKKMRKEFQLPRKTKRLIPNYRNTYKTKPRLFTNLNIVPDLELDNYRLTFYYRDSMILLPVYLSGESVKNVVKAHQKFQDQLNKAVKVNQKEAVNYKKYEDHYLLEQATLNRQIAINKILLENSAERSSAARQQFGLTSFGLVNCDYFFRDKPLAYTSLAEVMTDQNGKQYEISPVSRIAILNVNVFMEVSSKNIPIYSNDVISITVLDDKTLGIIRFKGSGSKLVEQLTSIDISDKSAKEINQLILDVQ